MTSPYDSIPGKIFIGGIPPITTQDTIQQYFEQFGELTDCVLMQEKPTGKSRGFGFVTYRDSRIVDEVLGLSHMLDGKEVDCKRAVPRDQAESNKENMPARTRKLFVGGLPAGLTEDEFRSYFEQFGNIEDSVIIADKETGKSRGFGFVTFDNEESVELVIQRYYENKIDGKWIECKRAQPKDTGNVPNKNRNNKTLHPRGSRNPGSYQDGGNNKSFNGGRQGQEFSNNAGDLYSVGFGMNMNRKNSYSTMTPNYGQNYGDYQGNYNYAYGNMYPSNYGYGTGLQDEYNGGYGNAYPNPYGGSYEGFYNGGNMDNLTQQEVENNMMINISVTHKKRTGQKGGGESGSHRHRHHGGHGYGGNQARSAKGEFDWMFQNYQNADYENENSGVGPVKGSGMNRKEQVESRYYSPY